MTVTLTVDVGDEERVLLVPKHEGEYANVGTVADVEERVRLRGGAVAVSLTGLHRAVLGAARTDEQGRPRVQVDRGPDERVSAFLGAITDAGTLADTCAYPPDITFAQRVELLEKIDVIERLD